MSGRTRPPLPVASPAIDPGAADALAPVRVLIVDDHSLFRSGLARLLESDPRVEVVGEAADGDAAIRQAELLKPAVILMDIQMPKRDGIEATAAITGSGNPAKIIVLTTFESDMHVLRALRAGATGYLLKDSTPAGIVASILAAVSDAQVLAGRVAKRINAILAERGNRGEAYDRLTAREIQVLTLMSKGIANKRMAYDLKISEKTVRNHISNIYDKLHINDRAQAALYAVRKGLVEA